MNRCAIFAGGDMPDLNEYKDSAFWASYSYFICADCGYRHAVKLGILPDLIVGDFDSYGEELPVGVEVLRSVPEKDDTDTMLCLKEGLSRGFNDFLVVGGFGGRPDHALANLQTLHYAVARDGALYRGRPENDQSYMLCRLEPEQLRRLLLPLGPYTKVQVREMARALALPPADKPDSMEICFIPDGDHAAWIESRGVIPPEGDFLLDGVPAARHRGIHHYTVGQRKHFGVGFGKRVYVSEIRPETNEVCLSSDDAAVWRNRFSVRDVHWLIPAPEVPLECGVRVRHSRAPLPVGTVAPEGSGAVVSFPAPVRAPAPGQTAAFYDVDRLLGGGFITK